MNNDTSMVMWKGRRSWGGDVEATCGALRALYNAMGETDDPQLAELFHKGFKYVTNRLIEGRMYSTIETKALIQLLSVMRLHDESSIEVDGKQRVIKKRTAINEKFTAKNQIIAQVFDDIEIDYRKVQSKLAFRVGIDKSSIMLGERLKITVTMEEETTAPLCKIYLPACLGFIKGGASAQTVYTPMVKDTLIVEAYGVRKGVCGLYVVVHDMYDSEKIGIAPRIEITVE